MAPGAGEIVPVGVHVDVELFVGREHTGIEVAVLDPFAAAAEKVAGTAVFARRQGYGLGHFVPVGRVESLHAHLCRLTDRVARSRGEFFVAARLLVADQAVHTVFGGEIECFVLPAVARVT